MSVGYWQQNFNIDFISIAKFHFIHFISQVFIKDILVHRYRFGSRSIRRSVRSGSIKLKQTYEHLMENGDIGVNRMSSNRARPHDLDIKLLQAKRQQAEMRRYLTTKILEKVSNI